MSCGIGYSAVFGQVCTRSWKAPSTTSDWSLTPSSLRSSAIKDDESDVIWTDKFYKIPRWSPKEYDRLLGAYKRHVALVENLAFELTRATNLVCDRVRECLDPRFRLEEGAVLITSGMYADFTYAHLRLEYRGEERELLCPFPGIQKFARVGPKRDHWVRPSDF